jgi:hypothetical protein
VFVLVGWVRDHGRDKTRRKQWEIRGGMTLEYELETRRLVVDELHRRR